MAHHHFQMLSYSRRVPLHWRVPLAVCTAMLSLRVGELPLTHSNLVRADRLGNFNASVPLASHNRRGGLKVGDLSGTVNVTLDNVSGFGTLWSFSYGLDWVAFDKIHLDAILTDHKSAPSVQQLLGPPIFTPNVDVFDFVKGETVFVTEITGGTRTLQATEDRVASFGLGLGPFLGKTVFSAHYEQNRISDGIGALPPLTFSALGTVNARVFADFERIAGAHNDAWAKGARMSLGVTNLFDRRQTVRDSTGTTPVAFEPGYLDPAGRVVAFSVRKAF